MKHNAHQACKELSRNMEEAKASSLVSGWARLPSDLLDLILEKCIPISDYIRFGAVCKHWQLVSLQQKQRRLRSCHKELPMLMVPGQDNISERHGLYSVTQGKTCSFKFHVPCKTRCCGSSHGWLAFVDDNLVVTLCNPFTKRTICLPAVANVLEFVHQQAYTSDDHYIKKVVLSTDPSLFPNDYQAVVICDHNGSRLAHFKSGDDAWTHIDQASRFYYGLTQMIGFDDVIYYRGHFIAVSREGGVFSINVSNDPTSKPHVSMVVPMLPSMDDKEYLVESSQGDLLLVRKYQSLNSTETLSFKIFLLFSACKDKPRPEWIEEIETIGNDVFFLGDNQSLCVSASDFPGCDPNSIYFCSDDCVNAAKEEAQMPQDMAVFNLENRKLRKHYYCSSSSQRDMLPSIWILPTMV